MKKTIITYIVFILIGFCIGRMLFSETSFINLNKAKDRYYFIQEGEYHNDNIFDSVSNIKQKLLEYNNNKIYVYLAITKDLEVAEKITDIYNEKDTKVIIKEKYLKNEELKNNIEQFDLLIKSSKTTDEILKIQEVAIANYKEIMKNKENY